MKFQQLSFLVNYEEFNMYDGYVIKTDHTILTDNGLIELKKDQIFYMICKHKDGNYSVALPNEYGGSYGFTVTEHQFKLYFKCLNKKVYPKIKEIWNGNSWVLNPQYQ